MHMQGIELPSGDYALPGILETSLSLREVRPEHFMGCCCS
jgi:hypothetical protein